MYFLYFILKDGNQKQYLNLDSQRENLKKKTKGQLTLTGEIGTFLTHTKKNCIISERNRKNQLAILRMSVLSSEQPVCLKYVCAKEKSLN